MINQYAIHFCRHVDDDEGCRKVLAGIRVASVLLAHAPCARRP
jgi:hypothetical protein